MGVKQAQNDAETIYAQALNRTSITRFHALPNCEASVGIRAELLMLVLLKDSFVDLNTPRVSIVEQTSKFRDKRAAWVSNCPFPDE